VRATMRTQSQQRVCIHRLRMAVAVRSLVCFLAGISRCPQRRVDRSDGSEIFPPAFFTPGCSSLIFFFGPRMFVRATRFCQESIVNARKSAALIATHPDIVYRLIKRVRVKSAKPSL
jgi:hypothetical protein